MTAARLVGLGLCLAALAGLAACKKAPSPKAVEQQAAAPRADGLQWTTLDRDGFVELALAKPGGAETKLKLRCKPGTGRIMFVQFNPADGVDHPVGSSWGAALTLTSGELSAVYSGSGVSDADGPRVESRFLIEDVLIRQFLTFGRLRVGGEVVDMQGPAEKTARETFLASCRTTGTQMTPGGMLKTKS